MLLKLPGATRRWKVINAAAIVFAFLFVIQALWLYWSWTAKVPTTHRPRPADTSTFDRSAPIVPCRGPRNGLLDDPETQDLPRSVLELPNITFPEPTVGSFEVFGLEKSWMTFDQRYGPYGFGEDREDYAFDKVDWARVNWGELQRECIQRNEPRLGPVAVDDMMKPRFRFEADGSAPPAPAQKTGRQAIILRAWSSFDYHAEDLWNIRSMITEAALASGGEYQVILLVDVKDPERGPLIHKDDEIYRQVLEESVPQEFWEIAVLFHPSLQEDLYPKVGEWSSFWQIMQPLQLVGHFFPEFDHFWQIEMDARFTGNAGKILHAFSEFGRQAPYKQARERASWAYMPKFHGSYEKFTNDINGSLEGGANVWGPLRISQIDPVGFDPPCDPTEDNFEYGVGSDADLLLFSVMNEISRFQSWEDWQFKDWTQGIWDSAPRFMSIPAQARASWELLEAIHQAQHRKGIRVHSEATLPTFAMWNGLKVVGLPMPMYQRPERNPRELYRVLNGDYPWESPDGIASGAGRYRAAAVAFYLRQITWDWWGTLPNNMFEWWMQSGESKEATTLWPPDKPDPFRMNIPDEIPWFMSEVEGKTYVPGFFIHPRKTNK